MKTKVSGDFLNRKLAAFLIIPPILLGVALLLVGTSLTEDPVPTSIQVTLIIDYQGFASNEEYRLLLPPGNQTVFDAMVQANLTMKKTGSGVLVFVEAINGIHSNQERNNRWWQFWVDGELAPIGAGSYILSEGAVVEWRYTSPQQI